MEGFADERDYRLLERDRCTFFVLRRVIDGECKLLLTDHESLIICYSSEPHPVWIWTADKAPDGIKERAYRLASEHSLIREGMYLNVKYELAEYFAERAAKDGKRMLTAKNMFAYECPAPVPPSVRADGDILRCTDKDLDELTEFTKMFHEETGVDIVDDAGYRASAASSVADGKTFFWQNGEGKNVACCNYRPVETMASIGRVYTRPEFRRRYYASNLVYRVTVIAKEAGFVPMLYTDADYAASNACYEKIGYELRGKLCSVTFGG